VVKSGGYFMFMGEYHHSIDEKKRLIIPSKFREELGPRFIITRGIENCLFVYSENTWKNITNKLSNLPFTKKNARDFNRFFLSGATTAELDRSGRVLITSPQISYAEITKECVIVGVGDRLEIWSEDRWNEFYLSTSSEMSDIAENLYIGSEDNE